MSYGLYRVVVGARAASGYIMLCYVINRHIAHSQIAHQQLSHVALAGRPKPPLPRGGGSRPGAGARPGAIGTSSCTGGIGGTMRPRRLRRGGSNMTRIPSTADSAARGATSDQLPPNRRDGTSFSWVARPIGVPSKVATDQSMRTRLRPEIGGAVVTAGVAFLLMAIV